MHSHELSPGGKTRQQIRHDYCDDVDDRLQYRKSAPIYKQYFAYKSADEASGAAANAYKVAARADNMS